MYDGRCKLRCGAVGIEAESWSGFGDAGMVC